MSEKGITNAQKLSGMLASLTAFLCTTLIFLNAAVMDLSVLIYALSIVVPATLITGFLGYSIGKIFDSKKKKKSLKKFMK